MGKLLEVEYQAGEFWVAETNPGEFNVFLDGLTHSICIGEAYPTLDLAIARADYIAKNWDVQKHWNRLVREHQMKSQID